MTKFLIFQKSLINDMAKKVKKKKKRIPVPKKPPKVEKSQKAYDRKKGKKIEDDK